MHELVYMMGSAPFCTMSPVITCGWGKHHLHLPYLAFLSIKYDLTQKLDLEAVAIIAS